MRAPFATLLLLIALGGCAGDPGGGRASPTAVATRDAQPGSAASAAVASAPLAVSSEAWTFEDVGGLQIRTPSYRIYTTLDEKSLLVQRLPRFMEAALSHYTGALGPLPRPQAPMESYVFANRPQWARQTQRVMGAQAETYLLIRRGGFAANGRAILYDIGVRDTLAIAAHEGWHQYTQRVFRHPLPVWLEEGLACYMEGYRWNREAPEQTNFLPWANLERYETLRRAERNGDLMSLDALTASTPQDLMARDEKAALTYYAQVWALVHFLAEGDTGAYAAGLRSMLLDAAEGRLSQTMSQRLGERAGRSSVMRRRGDAVLRAYAGKSAGELEESYRAFVTHVCRIGARQQIVQGASPLAAEQK